MKKLLVLLSCLLSSLAIADDTYNSTKGSLYMPVVNVGNDVYEVDMQHQGNLNFQVTRASEIRSVFPYHSPPWN